MSCILGAFLSVLNSHSLLNYLLGSCIAMYSDAFAQVSDL